LSKKRRVSLFAQFPFSVSRFSLPVFAKLTKIKKNPQKRRHSCLFRATRFFPIKSLNIKRDESDEAEALSLHLAVLCIPGHPATFVFDRIRQGISSLFGFSF
jgi:hypothetical protein